MHGWKDGWVGGWMDDGWMVHLCSSLNWCKGRSSSRFPADRGKGSDEYDLSQEGS